MAGNRQRTRPDLPGDPHGVRDGEGAVADQRWRALLYIGTGNGDLWAWLAPRLDFAAGRIRMDGNAQVLSGESRELLVLAQHFFAGQPAELNVAALLQRLDDRGRAVVLAQ